MGKRRVKTDSQGVLQNDWVNVGCLSLGHGWDGESRGAHDAGQGQGGDGRETHDDGMILKCACKSDVRMFDE